MMKFLLDGVTQYIQNNGIFEFDPKILDIPKLTHEISGGDADYTKI